MVFLSLKSAAIMYSISVKLCDYGISIFEICSDYGLFKIFISVLRVALGPRVASCKSALNPLVVYSTDRSKASASVAQLDAPSNWRPGGCGFNPRQGRQHSFVEIDHEIFSTVILSLPLIQEGQLSVSGERMCTILVNRLED